MLMTEGWTMTEKAGFLFNREVCKGVTCKTTNMYHHYTQFPMTHVMTQFPMTHVMTQFPMTHVMTQFPMTHL
jgi:hypothetical protein